MSNVIEYKGYIGSVEFSEQDIIFFGKILGIQALVSYEGKDAQSLIEDFHNAVDCYLESCKERGEEPEKAYNMESFKQNKVHSLRISFISLSGDNFFLSISNISTTFVSPPTIKINFEGINIILCQALGSPKLGKSLTDSVLNKSIFVKSEI